MKRVSDLLSDLAAGRGGILWIEGEPGLGKSALLAAAADGARLRACGAWYARATESAPLFPLRALLDALDPDPAPRAGDDPAVGGPLAGAVPLVDPVMASVEDLIARVETRCAAEPTMLALDDLQWCDDASLLVWQRLSGLVGQLPLLLAAACRTLPRRPHLTRLRRAARSAGAVLLDLQPLSFDDARAMAVALLGAVPDPELTRLVQDAAGNPLYIEQVVAAARQGSALPAGKPDRAAAAEPPPGTSLESAIDGVLGALSGQTQDLLRSAALLGVEFSVADLATVTGRTPSLMIIPLAEAIAAGTLTERPDGGLAFRHELVRAALYRRWPPQQRRAAHRQAAQALDRAGMPIHRVAEHLAAAGSTDEWSIGWLGRAGEMLALRAPTVAADLLGAAVQAVGLDSPVGVGLAACLATVLLQLDRLDELELLAQRVGSGALTADQLGHLTWSRLYGAMLRNAEGARAVLAEIADQPAGALTPQWQLRVDALRALVRCDTGELDGAARLARRVAGMAGADPMAAGYALHVLALLAGWRWEPAQALEHARSALARIESEPRLADLRVLLLSNLSYWTDELHRPEETDAAIRQMLQAAERLGSPRRLAMCRKTAATIWYFRGRWDDAAAELEILAGHRALQAHGYLRLQVHGLAALIAEHRDDTQVADRHLRVLEEAEVAGWYDVQAGMNGVRVRAVRAERRGDLRQALSELRLVLEATPAPDVHELPNLVRVALACGHRSAAERAVDRVSGAAAPDNPERLSAGQWCAGLLAGDPEPVLAAVELYRQADRRYTLARALEDAAVLLAGTGRAAIARRHHAEAVETYTALGARWDRQRADSRLAACGLRTRATAARPATGWRALSAAELQVAELVARGLSNQEIADALFVSRGTVQVHLSHALGKLGLGSRVDIAREAVRHGLVDAERPAAPHHPTAAGHP
jgi:DNA-binding CsgD family transcriptional regulator